MRLTFKLINTDNPLYPKSVRIRYTRIWQPYLIFSSPRFEEKEKEAAHIVALHGKKVVGVVCLAKDERYHWMRLQELAVDKAFERQGIGKALVQYATAHANALGYAQVGLYAYEESAPFFEKNGFCPLSGWLTTANGRKFMIMAQQVL